MGKKIRIMIRWIHIVSALIILSYVYSPFHDRYFFQIIMKFIVIPVVTLTGIWIWKFRQFNKFFRINSD